jgi:NADP-dependent 3-hydroxy acid dehydrogenase YdfG
MDGPLKDQVAIITGGGTGIGAATSVRLARAGARVVLVGRRAAVLETQADRLRQDGHDAQAVPADVGSYADLERVVAATLARHGRIDVLVANAAVVDHTSIADADPAEWHDLVTTNVLGVLYSVRAVLGHMLARGSGHVVIVSSVSGRVTYVGEPAYVSSKHATVAFADCLRQEVSPRGVRVTAIEPGLVDTPLVRANLEAVSKVVPSGVQPLDSDDCARAILFALEQPAGCSINEIVLRPTAQLV